MFAPNSDAGRNFRDLMVELWADLRFPYMSDAAQALRSVSASGPPAGSTRAAIANATRAVQISAESPTVKRWALTGAACPS